MFDTQLTIVGNVLTAPQWRRTTESGQVAASFRVASNSRRYDKATGRWVDGHSLRVRVTCWRRLAEGVIQSVMTGDPIVVVGRLYTRDWVDEQGTHRVLYEMDAAAVGHDLSRGKSEFKRHTTNQSTSAIEDEEAERRIGGEDTVPEDLDPTPDLHAAGFAAESPDADPDQLDDKAEMDKGHRVLVDA